MIPELVIGFQVHNVLLQNTDSTAKNHFLFRDEDDGRWLNDQSADVSLVAKEMHLGVK